MFQSINYDNNKRNGNNFKPMYNQMQIKIHETKYYSPIKKNKNNVICSDMEGPREVLLSDASQRKKKMSHAITYLWDLKKCYK